MFKRNRYTCKRDDIVKNTVASLVNIGVLKKNEFAAQGSDSFLSEQTFFSKEHGVQKSKMEV